MAGKGVGCLLSLKIQDGQWTALHLAVIYWDAETAEKVVRLLLTHGARLDARDKVRLLFVLCLEVIGEMFAGKEHSPDDRSTGGT